MKPLLPQPGGWLQAHLQQAWLSLGFDWLLAGGQTGHHPSGLLPVTWAGQEANTLVNLSWKPQQWSQEQGEAAHAQAQNSRQGGSWFCTGRLPGSGPAHL